MPSPTAEPVAAKIKAIREDHCAWTSLDMGHPFVMNPFVKPALSKKTAVYRDASQTRQKIYLIKGVNASYPGRFEP